MIIKNLKAKMLYLFVLGASLFILFIMIIGVWIGHEAQRLCQEAKWEYQKNECVEALMLTLDDEKQGFRTRNHAIWALGQFGDSRALTVLQKYYTGNIPAREPLDETISQYELKKAINLANGGSNLLAWLWRLSLIRL